MRETLCLCFRRQYLTENLQKERKKKFRLREYKTALIKVSLVYKTITGTADTIPALKWMWDGWHKMFFGCLHIIGSTLGLCLEEDFMLGDHSCVLCVWTSAT
jgi:hypothetical protein